MIKGMKERRNEGTREWENEGMSEQGKEGTSEWGKGGTREWGDEGMKEWRNYGKEGTRKFQSISSFSIDGSFWSTSSASSSFSQPSSLPFLWVPIFFSISFWPSFSDWLQSLFSSIIYRFTTSFKYRKFSNKSRPTVESSLIEASQAKSPLIEAPIICFPPIEALPEKSPL